jgi:citronellol/citronellal dehydrogenase
VSRALEGHVALITGASRGIGQGIAVRFAAEGAKVVAAARPEATRNKALPGSLGETLSLIEDAGGEAISGQLDLEELDFDKGQLFRDAERAFGAPVDILVNNAAATREFGADGLVPFAEMPREFFYRTISVNIWGAWDLAKHAVPGMRRRGSGWILSLSSIQASPRPRPDGIPDSMHLLGGGCLYGGSKAFLDRMTTGAAQELYRDNIAVNTLTPTSHIETPLSANTHGTTIVDPFNGTATEPIETFAEAALALCCGDPRELTSRIVKSLPLLAELDRPVYHLDGKRLFAGWQPSAEDPRTRHVTYLTATGH